MRRIILILTLFMAVVSNAQQLSLENIWNSREFSPKFTPGFNTLSDGKTFCRLDMNEDKSRSCNRYDIRTGNKIGQVFSTDKMLVDSQPIQIESYAFSQDEKKVLITNGFESVYRHSGMSNVYVFDLRTNKLSRVSNRKIMYPQFSPDGNKVAYVIENNLYYFDLVKNKEVKITSDGMKNSIINGAVDWVYEEEFSMSQGYEWSPDGQYLAYYKFNEEKVPFFSMDIFGSLYPKKEIWKYPKAGEANSKVDVYIHKLGKKKDVLCMTGSENDQYLPRIKWISTNYLSIQRLNRLQNKLEVLKFSYYFNQPEIIYTEENARYIDIEDWTFFGGKDSNGVYAMFTSEKSGYKHLYKLDGKYNVSQVTQGNWELDVFLGESNGIAYFTSGKDNPSERQLYSVEIKTGKMKQLTNEPGWHSISFTSTFDYF
ncbi:MAG TPA: DPP IV N-terminal domain-containing protein, partial [Bacteroidia bacterium]